MPEELIYHHQPVLLPECLEGLNLHSNSVIMDVTCGEGGHSLEIARKIPDGILICVDRNSAILEKAKVRLAEFKNIRFVNTTFDNIPTILAQEKINLVDGILADLGISMFHLKGIEEGVEQVVGFSYTDNRPLDMRLDHSTEISADTVINRYREEQIADILYQYGEEYESRRIARAIVKARPIRSSSHLAEVVMRNKGKSGGKIHPATKTFQALRIFINKELEILESFIPHAVDNLSENGRLVVMSYHSLEDRIVKTAFKRLNMDGKGVILTKKPIVAGDEEVRKNRAARSAKLRIFEKRSSTNG